MSAERHDIFYDVFKPAYNFCSCYLAKWSQDSLQLDEYIFQKINMSLNFVWGGIEIKNVKKVIYNSKIHPWKADDY